LFARKKSFINDFSEKVTTFGGHSQPFLAHCCSVKCDWCYFMRTCVHGQVLLRASDSRPSQVAAPSDVQALQARNLPEFLRKLLQGSAVAQVEELQVGQRWQAGMKASESLPHTASILRDPMDPAAGDQCAGVLVFSATQLAQDTPPELLRELWRSVHV